MYCNACGRGIQSDAVFCSYCGGRVGSAPLRKSLVRPIGRRMIGGVAAGMADFFDLDISVIRLAWVLVAVCTGVGFLAYIIAWLVVPSEREYVYVPQAPATAPPGRRVKNH